MTLSNPHHSIRNALRELDSASVQPRVFCSGCDLSRAGAVMQAWAEGDRARTSTSFLAALMNDCEEFVSEFDAFTPTLFILEGLLEYLDPAVHLPLFRILNCAVSDGGGAGEPRHMVALQNLEPSFGGEPGSFLPLSLSPSSNSVLLTLSLPADLATHSSDHGV